MTITLRKVLNGLCVTAAATVLLAATAAAQKMPQTTKEKIKGAATVTTQQLKGTVTFLEGNDLVVRMSSGEIREFHIPDSRKFIIDGREVSVHDLKVGTKLKATITTTTTSVTDRTTTVLTGRVWFVAGNTVILTLPNNENRQYKVKDSYKFIVDGKQASVFDLRKGMTVNAEKIVEEPKTEIASNTVVTGQAPPPEVVAEAAPAPAPEPAKAAPTPEPAPTPAPEPAPAPEPQMPPTASPLPLIGMLGFLFTGASIALNKLRRH